MKSTEDSNLLHHKKKEKIMRQMRADLAAWCMIFDGFQETIKFNNFLQFIPLKEPLKDTERPFCLQNRAQHADRSSFSGRIRHEQKYALIFTSPHLSVQFDVKPARFHHCLQELCSKAASSSAAGPGAASDKHLAPLRFDTSSRSHTFPP